MLFLPSFTYLSRGALVLVMLVSLCLGGCATTPTPATRVTAKPAVWSATASSARAAGPQTLPMIPVVREGRYTLVELAPEADQRDLMQQIVDVTVPPTLTASVGDALRYVLLRSGFGLCQSPDVGLLDRLPLPAADLHLGPMSLEVALQTLVGAAWHLRVNEVTRQVCFAPDSDPLPIGQRPSSHSAPRARITGSDVALPATAEHGP